jgi:nitroreductase
LVKKRYSCRTFDNHAIRKSDCTQISKYIQRCNSLFGNTIKLKLVQKTELKKENLFTTGTYGMIKGVQTFLAGVMGKNSPHNWEDFGYCLENAVIFATDLGLNSCWIGGVFDRKTFGSILDLQKNEIIPAVIALGQEAKKRVLRDRIVRWSAKGDQRKDPKNLFFWKSLAEPVQYSAKKSKKSILIESAEQIKPEITEILENIRLAPSASNKQPWRIILEQQNRPTSQKSKNRIAYQFHFYLSRDKLYRNFIPQVDLQRIDMGIALFHFEQSVYERSLKLKPVDQNPGISNLPKNYEYIMSYKVHS